MSTTKINLSNDYIGAMCSYYRKKKQVTQQQVANDCGVSRELVSKFERGALPNSLVFFWYIKNGIFNWLPVEKWNGWEGMGIYGQL